MYCPNCGKENPGDYRFCMDCGAELIDNQDFENESPIAGFVRVLKVLVQTIKKGLGKVFGALKRHKKISLPIVAVLLIVYAISFVGNHLFTPQRVAEQYFNAVASVDANTAYDCIDTTESPFTDRDSFEKFWTNNYEVQDIYNYTVSEQQNSGYGSKQDGLDYTYTFRYYLHGDSSAKTASVTVVKDSKKKLLFFNDYKVLPDFIVNGYGILVPNGTSVTFNGVVLDTPEINETSDYYALPAVFAQPYDIELSSPLGGSYTETIYPSNYDVYTCYDMQYSEEVNEQVYEMAVQQVKSIFASCMDYSDFPQEIMTDPNSEVYNEYQALKERLYDPSTELGYYDIKLTRDSNDTSTQYFSADTQDYSCRISFQYTYARNELNWWDDEMETRTGNSSGSATMNYSYENGQWVLYDFNIRY